VISMTSSMTPHELLIRDLKVILAEAEAFEFHDFKNTKYAQPKMTLYTQLSVVIERIKNGDYDNDE